MATWLYILAIGHIEAQQRPEATIAVFLTLVFIGIAIPSAYILLTRNAIGEGRWYFRDTEGMTHCHLKALDRCSDGTYRAFDYVGRLFAVPHLSPILKVRLGGWFRSNAVLLTSDKPTLDLMPSDYWEISRAWDRGFITIREKKPVLGFKLGFTLSPELALDYITAYPYSFGLFGAIDQETFVDNKSAGANSVSLFPLKKILDVEQERDYLGVAMCVAREMIAQSRQRMGDSKYMELVRKYLEGVLQSGFLKTGNPNPAVVAWNETQEARATGLRTLWETLVAEQAKREQASRERSKGLPRERHFGKKSI